MRRIVARCHGPDAMIAPFSGSDARELLRFAVGKVQLPLGRAMATEFFFFARPQAVLREYRRVLAPGGRLAVFTIPPELRGTPAAPEPMASRGHLYADADLADLARQAGLSDVAVRRTRNGGRLLTARHSAWGSPA